MDTIEFVIRSVSEDDKRTPNHYQLEKYGRKPSGYCRFMKDGESKEDVDIKSLSYTSDLNMWNKMEDIFKKLKDPESVMIIVDVRWDGHINGGYMYNLKGIKNEIEKNIPHQPQPQQQQQQYKQQKEDYLEPYNYDSSIRYDFPRRMVIKVYGH